MAGEAGILNNIIGKSAVNQAKFTADDTWTVPTSVYFIDALIVGGGGGGTSGGGGEIVFLKDYPVEPGTDLDITVGAGGTSGNNGGWSGIAGLKASGGSTTQGGTGQNTTAGGHSGNSTLANGVDVGGKISAIPGAGSSSYSPFGSASNGGGASFGDGESSYGGGGGSVVTTGADGVVIINYSMGRWNI
jgi:hypothetical protein